MSDTILQGRAHSGRPDRDLAELQELSDLARRLGVESNPDDFDTGLTTDDMG